MDRSSNTNARRKDLRKECRAWLAKHVEQQLGLKLKPEQVRSKPRLRDGYAWRRESSQDYLFEKNLSKSPSHVLRTLCREVGHTIMAVKPEMNSLQWDHIHRSDDSPHVPHQSQACRSPTWMEAEIGRLQRELDFYRARSSSGIQTFLSPVSHDSCDITDANIFDDLLVSDDQWTDMIEQEDRLERESCIDVETGGLVKN